MVRITRLALLLNQAQVHVRDPEALPPIPARGGDDLVRQKAELRNLDLSSRFQSHPGSAGEETFGFLRISTDEGAIGFEGPTARRSRAEVFRAALNQVERRAPRVRTTLSPEAESKSKTENHETAESGQTPRGSDSIRRVLVALWGSRQGMAPRRGSGIRSCPSYEGAPVVVRLFSGTFPGARLRGERGSDETASTGARDGGGVDSSSPRAPIPDVASPGPERSRDDVACAGCGITDVAARCHDSSFGSRHRARWVSPGTSRSRRWREGEWWAILDSNQ